MKTNSLTIKSLIKVKNLNKLVQYPLKQTNRKRNYIKAKKLTLTNKQTGTTGVCIVNIDIYFNEKKSTAKKRQFQNCQPPPGKDFFFGIKVNGRRMSFCWECSNSKVREGGTSWMAVNHGSDRKVGEIALFGW